MEAAGSYPAEIIMGLTEILLIVLGILAVAASFMLPETLDEKKASKVSIPEEKIKELVEKEVKQAVYKIEEKTDETVSSAAEKTERYMERISNEKIMAIEEYSNTVLSQINKNHEEAVFLYDMLNHKHTQVKNTAAELKSAVREAKEELEQGLPGTSVNAISEDAAEGFTSQEMAWMEETALTGKDAENNAIEETEEAVIGNSKKRILELHQEGKSNVFIAQNLGIGIGEVKLIIDLFESGIDVEEEE